MPTKFNSPPSDVVIAQILLFWPFPFAVVAISLMLGCATKNPSQASPAPSRSDASTQHASRSSSAPPPRIQAWMDRLTVAHAYDPSTGFIVARETIP